MKYISLILLVLLPLSISSQNKSKIVFPDKDGKLVYTPYTNEGDILPDFSFCGYRGGGVALPDVETKIVIEPGNFENDDSKRIQDAINKLTKEKADNKGFKGAILLKKGKYNIQNTIRIPYSGIVIRGEGNDENGTVLVATKPSKYTLFYIGTTDRPQKDRSSERQITDNYVPSGTSKITVSDASDFKKGDQVIIERPSTSNWITDIGMDKIDANWRSLTNADKDKLDGYRAEGKLSEDGKKYNTTVQWAEGSKNLLFERTITDIKGNQITLDIPLTNAFQKKYGGGTIYKYTIKNRPNNIGIENLRGECTFDKNETDLTPAMDEYYSDEKHADQFIAFGTCEDVWVRKLTSIYIDHGYKTNKWSRFVTIEDCEYLDPVSRITGGRRYGYHFQGQMALVQRCYARNGRHDFVLGSTVAGPNAFVDSKAEMCYVASEPHQRWATGCLFDNCSVSGPDAHFYIGNRGYYGTGHGWAGVQMVLWNCRSPLSIVMQPPTAQNFSIGSAGNREDEYSTPTKLKKRVAEMNKVAKRNFEYNGIPVVGDGYIEFPESYVSPQYLYYSQLKDRLGISAIKNITTPEQQEIILGK